MSSKSFAGTGVLEVNLQELGSISARVLINQSVRACELVSGGKATQKGQFWEKSCTKRAIPGEKPHKKGSFERKAAQKGAVSGERPHKKGQ